MKKVILYILIGIFLIVFGFLAGAFWTTLKFAGVFPFKRGSIEGLEEYSPPPDAFFCESRFFGGNINGSDNFKPPSEGKGILIVKLVYDGKPARNIHLRIVLNSKYKTDLLTTNQEGLITIPLEVGKWYINTIQCEGWDEKPEGQFILISGDEHKLDQGLFQDLFFKYSPVGKEIVISEQPPEKPHIILIINQRIKMVWPKDGKTKEQATIADSAILWDPYPNAVNYVIQINRVTHEKPNTTTYFPIIYNKVPTNFLPLSSLAHTQDKTAKEEYTATVQAYGSQGEFLSASGYFSGSFSLAGGNVLVKTEDLNRIRINQNEAQMNQEDVDEVYWSMKLLYAIEVLIKEQMFSEAENLLNKLSDVKMVREKMLLSGYLYAAQGDCSSASEFFKSAQLKGAECIPEEYKVNCK